MSLFFIDWHNYSWLNLNPAQKRLSSQVVEEQAGFQLNRLITDNIVTLKTLCENTTL